MQYNQIVFKKLAQIPKLSANEKLLLNSLASFTEMGTDSSTCYPSVSTLANMCSCTNRTVQRALNRLTKIGLVNRVFQYMKSGGQTSNLYTLNFADSDIKKAIEFIQTRTETPDFEPKGLTESHKTATKPAVKPVNNPFPKPPKAVETAGISTIQESQTTDFEPENVPDYVPESFEEMSIRMAQKHIESDRWFTSQSEPESIEPCKSKVEVLDCKDIDSGWLEDEPDPFDVLCESVRSQYPEWSEVDVLQLVCSIELENKKESGFWPTSLGAKVRLADMLLPESLLPVVPIEFEGFGIDDTAEIQCYSGQKMPESLSSYWLTPNVPKQVYLNAVVRPNPALSEWKEIRFERMPLVCSKDERHADSGVWAWRKVHVECVQYGEYVNPLYGPMDADKIKMLISRSMYGEGPTKSDDLERKEAFGLIKSWFCDEFYPSLKQAQYTFQGAKDGGQLKNLVGYIFGTLSFQGIEPSAIRALELFQRIMKYGLNTKWKNDLLTLSTISGQYNQYISGAIESFKTIQQIDFDMAMDAFEASHSIEKRLFARKSYRVKSDFMPNLDANSLHYHEIQFLLATGLPLDYFYHAPYFHPYVKSQISSLFSPEIVSRLKVDEPWTR